MRTIAEHQGLRVKAYAGSTGVLLAMDIEPARRAGLLGFALQRQVPGRRAKWLKGMLHFPGVARRPGERFETREAPIQKFRWSDYSVAPGRRYTYTVHPVYGTPANPELADGVVVSLRTHGVRSGRHAVIFNRAAAASQAFSRDFPEVERAINAARRRGEPLPPLPDDARRWLSRGLGELIVRTIGLAADSGWALDVAIYEYELPLIVDAVRAAARRGAAVRIVYHARAGDQQSQHNRLSVGDLPSRPRLTSRIFHDKFLVLSRLRAGKRQPLAVLAGSTNFTENGVYRQANVAHLVRDAPVARTYLGLFEVLYRGDSVAETRAYIDATNDLDFDRPPLIGFSPRSGGGDLHGFARLIDGAARDVLFCTAFELDDSIEGALLGAVGDPILRYGVQNSRSTVTGFHGDRGADFPTAAMLSRGLEGFLKETTKGQRGNILIHTKLIVVDFTSDAPTVISGSHNFSAAASKGNDENFLVLRDTDVADAYGVELMRIYDHYRFRFYAREGPGKPLAPDHSWTNSYFSDTSLKSRDRRYFAGR